VIQTPNKPRAEAFSLTWDCVDFEKGRLIITNREGTADMPPFSIKDCEARRVPLPLDTIDLLTKWQTQAPEGVPYILLTKDRYERVKAKWQQLRKEGKPWRNRYMVNNVLRNFKSHYRRAGVMPVGKLTIHTLRKSCIQNWVDAVLPPDVVQKLAGHSSLATTMKYYTQVDPDREAKAARVIQERLDSKKMDVKWTYEPTSGQIGGVK
jgi:integrase